MMLVFRKRSAYVLRHVSSRQRQGGGAWRAGTAALLAVAGSLAAQAVAAPAMSAAPQCEALRGVDWMECHFRLGMRAAAERRWRAAIARFRAMLERDPSLARPRLELARAYFMIGNDDQAERHFRYALGGGLPQGVQRTVLGYLEAIKRRRTWTVSFDFSITPQSNVNRATRKRVIVVGGMPWMLTEDSRKQAGLQVRAATDFIWRPFLSDDLRGHLRINPQMQATTRRNSLASLGDLTLADTYIQLDGEAGLVWLADRQEVSFGLSGGRVWYRKRGYRHDYGLWLRGMQELNARTRLNGEVMLSHLKFDDAIERKGWELRSGVGLRRQLNASVAVTLAPALAWYKVKEKDRSYIAPGGSLSVDMILPHDFSLLLSGSLTRTLYRADDTVFAKRRRDWQTTLSSRLTWARFTAFDLAPYVQYTFEKRSSTILLHEYTNHAFMIGFTKTY